MTVLHQSRSRKASALKNQKNSSLLIPEVDAASLSEVYRDALDTHCLLVVTDKHGTILDVNDAFCQLSQYLRGELVGCDHSLLNSGYHHRSFFADLWQTISSGKVWSGNIRNRAKDGSFYWVRTSVVPCADHSGHVLQYVAVSTDITQHVLLEEKTQRLTEQVRKLSGELEAGKEILNRKEIALNELLTHIEDDKSRLKKNIAANIESIIFPLLESMKHSGNSLDRKSLDLMMQSLQEIAEPFLKGNIRMKAHLTPKELQICNMVRHGLSVKEIAEILHLSPRTVDKHRENIRRKLNIRSKKINLAGFLLSGVTDSVQ